jgi:hypothetical protein
MKRKHYLAWAASLLCSYCFSSEEVGVFTPEISAVVAATPGITFGQTQNAAAAGYNWVMKNILPQQAGLEINGIVYRYTTVKKPEDDMLVFIQNLNAKGDGYIFRNIDNWSQLPGNTIQRSIPINSSLAELWGDGSLEVQGQGSVLDASVVYTFQFNPCFIPQSSPECPGYKDPRDYLPNEEYIDPLSDEYLRREFERRVSLDDEDEKERSRARALANAERRQNRLESALSAVNTALLTAEAVAAAQDFFALAELPNSYDIDIPGGEYRETIRLVDAKLPDNVRALRNNWAQQLLHEQMIDLQYVNLETKE